MQQMWQNITRKNIWTVRSSLPRMDADINFMKKTGMLLLNVAT